MSNKAAPIRPRIILHGGAGNITRTNLPPPAYNAYRNALLSILHEANTLLQQADATALDIATYAVTLLENDALFNAGHGAVYTREGTHELEASVMVSHGYRKRGVGVMKVSRVRHPILLAKEMLVRGNEDGGGGARGHCQLAGEKCDCLAEEWGLEMCDRSYYWTKRRWQEHRRGSGLSYSDHEYEKAKHDIAKDGFRDEARIGIGIDGKDCCNLLHHHTVTVANDPSWDGNEYLPQGTVGCVVLDSSGRLCVATSTGGVTNKLPGRIGDTPTLGAGFWAEEWPVPLPPTATVPHGLGNSVMSPAAQLAAALGGIADCVPGLFRYLPIPDLSVHDAKVEKALEEGNATGDGVRAVAMSGTGNGDSFLRLAAVRTAAAMARFSHIYIYVRPPTLRHPGP